MRTIQLNNKPVHIWTDDIEEEALKQLENLHKLPFIHKHLAVMPDVHAGKGSTIGTVIASKGAIIPAAIGVDIGCGMSAYKLPFQINEIENKLPLIRSEIEKCIPVGFHANKKISETLHTKINGLGHIHAFGPDSSEIQKSRTQCGSLGGGNHFIEICYDDNNDAWVMLHSGSRNIGKVIADYHINKAKGLMKDYFIDLADTDLAYLVNNSTEYNQYLHDMHWAQNFAKLNRHEMIKRILTSVFKIKDFPYLGVIDCHHNYCQLENHFGSNVIITRKGAISAKDGEYGIIPGSMGQQSFIVRGLGNPLSFCSASHGAGRKMSRTKARNIFTQQDLVNQTMGVECRKDKDIIDEIPGAYKDINEVMNNQKDLIEIVYTLKQVICVKG